jgi:hypothetical protein
MGWDISIYATQVNEDTAPCGSELDFYITYNHSDYCKEYKFYPRDFNGKTVGEVQQALNQAISKMKIEGIIPVDYSYDKSVTPWDINKKVFLTNLIEIRNKIDSSWVCYDYYWYSD